jgi:hypothetical protein
VTRPTHSERLAILRRRTLVANRSLCGQRQHEIANSLEITIRTVKRDLHWIKQQWLAELLQDYDARKARELAKLDLLEQCAWQSWERSLVAKEVSETRRAQDDAEAGKHQARVEATLRREQRDGDPKFLAIILNCVSKRCEILGIGAQSPPGGAHINILNVHQDRKIENLPGWLLEQLSEGPGDENGNAELGGRS